MIQRVLKELAELVTKEIVLQLLLLRVQRDSQLLLLIALPKVRKRQQWDDGTRRY